MIVLKNILVPTDFGEPSQQALKYGRHFARQFGATLHVMHTVQNVMIPGGAEVPVAAVQQVEAGLESVANRQMDDLVTEDDRSSFPVVTAVRSAPAAAPDIVDYAKTHGIDLIVMGTHGRGVIGHLIMGSVAERSCGRRRARCSPCASRNATSSSPTRWRRRRRHDRAVKLSALALDFDGTISRDGRLDPAVAQAIAEVRERGIVVVLVTGRRLDDLHRSAGDLLCFDAIVGENGAVLEFPARRRRTCWRTRLRPPSSMRSAAGASTSTRAPRWWRRTAAWRRRSWRSCTGCACRWCWPSTAGA
ncbi:MAG: universal stress protein [Vicinamibacterales bacterium]